MSIKDYEQILSNLDDRISTAAKLRALYPVIEKDIAAGASLGMILDDLKSLGLNLNYAVLQNALARIQKQSKTVEPLASQTENASPLLATPAPAPTTAPAPITSVEPTERTYIPGVSMTPRRIESPADLRAVRNMQIDLNALREEGLAKRRQKK